MFDQSVVRRSGQWWKLTTGFAGVVVAGGVLIYGISRGHFASILCGIALVAMAMFATFTAVRCPRCRDRWVWRAVRTRDANAWLPWLLVLRACPICGGGSHESA